jgi:hypothetical protein
MKPEQRDAILTALHGIAHVLEAIPLPPTQIAGIVGDCVMHVLDSAKKRPRQTKASAATRTKHDETAS